MYSINRHSKKALFKKNCLYFSNTSIKLNIFNTSVQGSQNTKIYRENDFTSPLENVYMKKLKQEKELIKKILETIPSKREANTYLRNYSVEQVASHSKQEISTTSNASEKSKSFPVAIINIQAPLDELHFSEVAKNIAYLHRLGLNPIITLENNEWYNNTKNCDLNSVKNFTNTRRLMIKDALSFCELIEMNDVQSRLITTGAFETSQPFCIDNKVQFNSKVDCQSIVSCLKSGCVPILVPITSASDSHFYITSSSDTIPALSKAFSRYSNEVHKIGDKTIDVVKVVLINSNGGVRSTKNNRVLPFINLEEEYHNLRSHYKKAHNTNNRDLEIAYNCLSYLPATASAVVLKASTVGAVVGNLITDKPLNNPSLSNCVNTTGATVMRYGLELKTYRSLKSVNIDKLFDLMESSFGKKLERKNFELRLLKHMDKIVLAGDYQGCTIVTKESIDGVPYLDKFAVDPNSQGIGVADVLWQRLREDYKNLVWRSRSNNGVNKWYFERCDGNFRIPGSQWVMFWFGQKGMKHIYKNIEIAQSIPPSFIGGTCREPTK